MEKFVCKHPWAHFEVNNPNGDVTMCCNNDTVLGNVGAETLEQVWNGKKFTAIRRRMLDDGAHAMCPHTCPVLKGGKRYENMDWFTELSADGLPRRNAELNEREFAEGKTELQSKPRWLRFTYSYACNLDCYHCYQRIDATKRTKLPKAFMDRIDDHSEAAQVVLPFGGEPFFFGPVVEYLEKYNANRETRFYFITNATILTDRIFDNLERLSMTCMDVSLDAATPESFEALRLRGANASWDTVLVNLGRLRDMKRRKGFRFTVSMTLNSTNAGEIERFVDLALGFDAEPLILLVANPFQTQDFQKQYLTFSEEAFAEAERQIDRSLPKVRSRDFEDGETYLRQLRAALRDHCKYGNSPLRYRAENAARSLLRRLPGPLREPIRSAVQKARIRRIERDERQGNS